MTSSLTQEQAAQLASMIVVSDTEMVARTLIARTRLTREWNDAEALVCAAFSAKWGSSLPLTDIIKIGGALSFVDIKSDEAVAAIRKALTALVRAGMLRSQVHRGERHWELVL